MLLACLPDARTLHPDALIINRLKHYVLQLGGPNPTHWVQRGPRCTPCPHSTVGPCVCPHPSAPPHTPLHPSTALHTPSTLRSTPSTLCSIPSTLCSTPVVGPRASTCLVSLHDLPLALHYPRHRAEAYRALGAKDRASEDSTRQWLWGRGLRWPGWYPSARAPNRTSIHRYG